MDSDKIILSIIIPTYNQGNIIQTCLNSLLNQDIDNYEIIIVNDGSTDNTKDVISKFQEEYNIISIINQENQGQGIARNAGISIAKGKYIMFVDSDDYLEKNALSVLINKMEINNLDLLYGNYNKVDLYGNILKKSNVEKIVKYTTSVMDHGTFLKNHFGFYCYVYLFVFRKEMLINLKFSFKPHIYLEDTEWLSKVIYHTDKISMIDFSYYNYVQTPNSSMRDPKKLEKILHDTLYVIKCLKTFKDESVHDNESSLWFNEIISFNAIMVCSTVAKKGFMKYKNSALISLKESDVFPLKLRRMPIKFKLTAHIINFNWNLAVFLISIINKIKR